MILRWLAKIFNKTQEPLVLTKDMIVEDKPKAVAKKKPATKKTAVKTAPKKRGRPATKKK
jgi:hypothetical protein